MCERNPASWNRQKVRFGPGVFIRWGFAWFFLCLGKTRLPTCLSLVTRTAWTPSGAPKNICSHSKNAPSVFLKEMSRCWRLRDACYFSAAAAATLFLLGNEILKAQENFHVDPSEYKELHSRADILFLQGQCSAETKKSRVRPIDRLSQNKDVCFRLYVAPQQLCIYTCSLFFIFL